MKQKVVSYKDLYNPDEIIQAYNKLKRGPIYLRAKVNGTPTKLVFQSLEEKIKYYRERAIHKTCKCHHPWFTGGSSVCQYRNCYHSVKEHF